MEITISDNGIGIAKKDIPKVLSEYEQITSGYTRKHNKQGTGLGLPLSKKMVELHKGIFKIESKLNKGTSVIILDSDDVFNKLHIFSDNRERLYNCGFLNKRNNMEVNTDILKRDLNKNFAQIKSYFIRYLNDNKYKISYCGKKLINILTKD